MEPKTYKKKGKKSEFYVNPTEFEEQIKESYRNDKMGYDLCMNIIKLANKLSYSPNFINYTFRDEMVQDAIEKMTLALHKKIYKHNPNKISKSGKPGNAFMYFTRIAYNAMVNRIKIEEKNKKILDAYQEEVYHQLLSDSPNGGKIKSQICYDEENQSY